ncbi:MAG TPA: nitroreductase family deazaflavin-dependent oxidoreductase [Chloroflexota bacterium]
MPLPRFVARFNKVITNRLFAPVAGRVPPWAVVEHTGRRSGQTYRTVVWAFPRGSDLVIALTYGPGADWVRNVLSAGRCRVRWRGQWRVSHQVEVISGPAALALLPPLVRPVLTIAGVHSVLHLRGR